MEDGYTFHVPGEMRGKQRARVTVRGGFARAYTPQQTVTAENWIKVCALDQGVIRPLDGPLALSIIVERMVPASWSKKRRAAALGGVEKPTGKPDVDNLAKLVGDALNGVCWHDDAQIVQLSVVKRYGEMAGAEIAVRPAV